MLLLTSIFRYKNESLDSSVFIVPNELLKRYTHATSSLAAMLQTLLHITDSNYE